MSGDARGLQTRSEAPRGVFGRFNSYPFPPLINLSDNHCLQLRISAMILPFNSPRR